MAVKTTKCCKDTILYGLVFSCSGGLPAISFIKPCFIAIFCCYKEQDQLRCVLHSGVFPKQDLLTHPMETVDY